MSIDETMSQDQAFSTNNGSPDTFKFDAEPATPASQAESAPVTSDAQAPQDEENDANTSASPVGTEDEQKVPYSRFKKKVDELSETTSKIQLLEERLAQLETQSSEESTQDVNPDDEWTQLYGDSDVAKRAWAVQQKREAQIEARAIEKALDLMNKRQEDEITQLSENEDVIDENLENLQEKIGRKLTAKQEEDILSIVDEFSPTGDDGKYVALFPFDKAYEIYTLRTSQKGSATRRARETVADLTGASSQGEADSSGSNFKRGWDNWRTELE